MGISAPTTVTTTNTTNTTNTTSTDNDNDEAASMLLRRVDRGIETNLTFSSKTVINAFIRKMYSILTAQLAVAAFIVSQLVEDKNAGQIVASNPNLSISIAIVVTTACMLVITCCEVVRRTTPANYILLFVFTVAGSFLLATICSTTADSRPKYQYECTAVLLAIGIAAIVCFAFVCFAFQTAIDLFPTSRPLMTATLFNAAVILIIFGLAVTYFPPTIVKPWRIVYACFGAFLFSAFLAYDTQMMVGKNQKHCVSPEEYVFAILNLYADIAQVFICSPFLSLIGLIGLIDGEKD